MMGVLLLFLCLSNSSCSQDKEEPSSINSSETVNDTDPIATSKEASIISITVSGSENNYTFNVGISSPDTGCEQYANWWEVITEERSLIYRRILGHSHVNEQPFVRSGGIVPITASQTVIIRAHMNTSGYGTVIYKGSVNTGFTKETLSADFANDLEKSSPQPTGCAF